MSCHNEHTHSHSHNHDSSDHVQPVPTSSAQNLAQYIDSPRLTALNCSVPNSELHKLFSKPQDEDQFSLKFAVSSDLDTQLILNIPFTGYVKLFSVILRTSGEEESCPKTIKLYKNITDLDFDNARKAHFTITHPQIGVPDDESRERDEDEGSFVEHYLPRAQFQGVTQLSLYVEDNWADDEDETVKFYHIEIRGQFQSPITKEPVIGLYEAAANPADHKNLLAQMNKNHSSV